MRNSYIIFDYISIIRIVKLLRKIYYAQPEHEVHEQQAQQSVQHSGAQQHAVLNRFNNFLKKAFISTPKVSLYYIILY